MRGARATWLWRVRPDSNLFQLAPKWLQQRQVPEGQRLGASMAQKSQRLPRLKDQSKRLSAKAMRSTTAL